MVAHADASRRSPLAFDELHVLARIEWARRPLDLWLDTANQRETYLGARFARDFPAVVKEGRSGTRRLTQVGGTRD